MSEPERVNDAATNQGRGKSMVFRKRRYAPAQTREEARRQSAIIQSAWSHFREAASMIAFLNTRHEALDVQPLSLAIESDAGLERGERLLRDLTRNT